MKNKKNLKEMIVRKSRIPISLPCSLTVLSTAIASGALSVSLKDGRSASGERPNVLFIMADDWGWGDLSCNGHDVIKTPNLDRLAEEGTRFQQFTVNSPVCSPSRAAFITGKFPGRFCIHHVFDHPRVEEQFPTPAWLDPDSVLLPRLFQDAGYKTALYGKWHLMSFGSPPAPFPINYGFDDVCVWSGNGPDQIRTLDSSWWPEEYKAVNADEYDPNKFSICSEMAVEKTMRFIEANKEDPFFVSLHIRDGHAPFIPLPSYREPYADIPEPFQSYYAVIGNADRILGRLFNFLEINGLKENTIVIFTSDNGPETPMENPDSTRYPARGETGGMKGRKRSLFEGGVRVPFIVRWPGVVPAGRTDEKTLLTAVDMLPTLCAAADIPLPAEYKSDGENFLEAFKGRETARTKPVLNSFIYTDKILFGHEIKWKEDLEKKWKPHDWVNLSIREGSMKLVYEYDTGRTELYDLSNDPYETNNLADQNPELTAELRARLKTWGDSLPREPAEKVSR